MKCSTYIQCKTTPASSIVVHPASSLSLSSLSSASSLWHLLRRPLELALLLALPTAHSKFYLPSPLSLNTMENMETDVRPSSAPTKTASATGTAATSTSTSSSLVSAANGISGNGNEIFALLLAGVVGSFVFGL